MCLGTWHLPILLDIALPVLKSAPSSIKCRSFKHFSEADFVKDLWTVPWCIIDLFDDVDDKVSAFNTLFQEVLEVHAPIKSVRVKKNPAPWISNQSRMRWTNETDSSKSTDEIHPLFCGLSSRHKETVWSFYRGKPKSSTSFTSFPPRPIPPPCGNHLNKLAERTKWIVGLPSSPTTSPSPMC